MILRVRRKFFEITTFPNTNNHFYSWPYTIPTIATIIFLLGNVVISKKILRTRKIMVMHSNERGECCLRILIDRSGSVDAT